MSVTDVNAQVRTWALAEAAKQAFGEDFGVDIIVSTIPTDIGVQVGYIIVLSCRSPLLGQGELFSMAPILSPQPAEEKVAEAVTETMRQLRAMAAQLLGKGTKRA